MSVAYNCRMKRRDLTKEEKEIADNLKRIWLSKKKELGLTQETGAAKMGWKSQGTFGQYINGTLPLNTDAKIKFAELLMVDVTDIDPSMSVPAATPTIPLLDLDVVGKWIPEGAPHFVEFKARIPKPQGYSLGSKAYAIEIEDNSLGDLAAQGSQLAIDPDSPPEHGKIAVFYLPDHGETHVGVYMSRAGKETLKFLDGSDSISLKGAICCGKAKVRLAEEL
ncbi:helix-turn-helix transcriptional regulator [Pseudomaricurvus alkylphenolicus]|uniref:helix-turn-helix domain-containing protein n=1 Tax=Pseudomaricurvus alkylphenolicus TaxID=1306991 RepID=UPI0014203CF2|nr:helix-turn-helix domain-containing protein [Pseudomaricurvus alkylphenolicus]NIB43776.1 helix-turn-helix transcriptional regulator [Pseudomaricurvus alkylphenolicus]